MSKEKILRSDSEWSKKAEQNLLRFRDALRNHDEIEGIFRKAAQRLPVKRVHAGILVDATGKEPPDVVLFVDLERPLTAAEEESMPKTVKDIPVRTRVRMKP